MTAVRGFLVPGEDSLEWWWRLRAQHRGTGLWPVLMTPETPDELTPFRIRSPEDEAALRYDGAALLAGWFEGRLARYGGDYADTLRAELRGEGEWRPRPELPGFGVSEYAEEVFVALVPVAAPWQVPLALHYGGWNEYPTPAEHAAILKHFHARYGAELVAMTGTTAEFTVKWPPRDRAGALRLAAEYRVYNDGEYDYYGADTLTDLAVSLSHATVWRAWWD